MVEIYYSRFHSFFECKSLMLIRIFILFVGDHAPNTKNRYIESMNVDYKILTLCHHAHRELKIHKTH